MRPIGQARRSDDCPVQAAPRDDILLCFMVGDDIAQNERCHDVSAEEAELLASAANAKKRKIDQSARSAALHCADDVIHAVDKCLVAFQRRRGTERTEHCVLSEKGALHSGGVSYVALNHV